MIVAACVKPTRLGEARVERGRAAPEGPWGLAPGERRALAAAKLVAAGLGGEVVALSVAPAEAAPALREALALGAARAVLVEAEGLDALGTARALAAAVQRLGAPVAVVGERSADLQQGIVGPMLAELLGRPFLAGAERVRAGAGLVEASGPLRRLRGAPPLVLAAGERFAPAAHATAWGVGGAFEAPLERWALRDLGVEPASEVEPVGAARADAGRREAEVFDGEPPEAAQRLARRWRAAGVVP